MLDGNKHDSSNGTLSILNNLRQVMLKQQSLKHVEYHITWQVKVYATVKTSFHLHHYKQEIFYSLPTTTNLFETTLKDNFQ